VSHITVQHATVQHRTVLYSAAQSSAAVYLVLGQQGQVQQDLKRLRVRSHDHKLRNAAVQGLGCCTASHAPHQASNPRKDTLHHKRTLCTHHKRMLLPPAPASCLFIAHLLITAHELANLSLQLWSGPCAVIWTVLRAVTKPLSQLQC